MSSASGPGEAPARIMAFLEGCSAELTHQAARSSSGDTQNPSASQIVDGAAAFAEALEASTALDFEPGWLPTLATIDAVDDTDLAHSFVEIASLLPWIPTTRDTDDGHDFALAPLGAVRDLGDLTVGIMYVRPGAQYPLHQHPPQELYLTLSGQARWRYGGNTDFRPLGPKATLYNHPHDLHSAVAGETPLVALYVLWP